MDATVDAMDVPTENAMNYTAATAEVVVDAAAAAARVNSNVAYVYFVLIFSVAMTIAAVSSLQFTLRKLGFGNNGVRSGSLAAAWQASKRGNVQRWTFFALLQSWGVKGVPLMLKFFVGYFTFLFTLLSFEPAHPVN
ncbi:hypothetical protein MTO96_003329 [Rhipicephalus appendiculatus]